MSSPLSFCFCHDFQDIVYFGFVSYCGVRYFVCLFYSQHLSLLFFYWLTKDVVNRMEVSQRKRTYKINIGNYINLFVTAFCLCINILHVQILIMGRENGLLNFLIFAYFIRYTEQNSLSRYPGISREIRDSGNGIPGNLCSGICPTLGESYH